MILRKYKVWWPDCDQTKDDARVFEGFDHEHAASEWAEWYDHHSAEYSIVGGTAAEVQVLREYARHLVAKLSEGQEPVAWMTKRGAVYAGKHFNVAKGHSPLYTAPPVAPADTTPLAAP